MEGVRQLKGNAAQGTGEATSAPDGIHIDRQALTVLLSVLAAPAPEEGCALLLGQASVGLWRVDRIWPCLNAWVPRQERRRRFAIDPREQLLAQKWCRPRERLVLGTAHSHPGSAPVPSATDLALTLAPTLMVILGRRGPAQPQEPLPPHRHTCAVRRPEQLLGEDAELACWWVAEPLPPEAHPDGPSAGPWTQPRRLPWRMEK